MTKTNQHRGVRGEDVAEAHLASHGLVVIDRNWRCRHGELDLVALEDGTLVFCEVKLRTGLGFGDPLEALTFAKVRRLRRLVAAWLAAHPDRRERSVRLDALGVLAEPGRAPLVRHVRGIGE